MLLEWQSGGDEWSDNWTDSKSSRQTENQIDKKDEGLVDIDNWEKDSWLNDDWAPSNRKKTDQQLKETKSIKKHSRKEERKERKQEVTTDGEERKERSKEAKNESKTKQKRKSAGEKKLHGEALCADNMHSNLSNRCTHVHEGFSFYQTTELGCIRLGSSSLFQKRLHVHALFPTSTALPL